MSGQVTDMSTAAEPSKVSIPEMTTQSPSSSADKLLTRIALLFFILVAGLLRVFG
jgi:hypothetical protein